MAIPFSITLFCNWGIFQKLICFSFFYRLTQDNDAWIQVKAWETSKNFCNLTVISSSSLQNYNCEMFQKITQLINIFVQFSSVSANFQSESYISPPNPFDLCSEAYQRKKSRPPWLLELSRPPMSHSMTITGSVAYLLWHTGFEIAVRWQSW